MATAMHKALECIRNGQCLIYPTETLYALGGDARDKTVAQTVCALKARNRHKPLPVLVGKKEHICLITDWNNTAFHQLAENFWPGPLSILVPGHIQLPPELKDARGRISLRVTSHPVAAALCCQTNTALIATSANRSGKPAAASPQNLDENLASTACHVVDLSPWPAGGPASTVVEILPDNTLRIHRQGAVPAHSLKEAGWNCLL